MLPEAPQKNCYMRTSGGHEIAICATSLLSRQQQNNYEFKRSPSGLTIPPSIRNLTKKSTSSPTVSLVVSWADKPWNLSPQLHFQTRRISSSNDCIFFSACFIAVLIGYQTISLLLRSLIFCVTMETLQVIQILIRFISCES